MTYSVAIHFMIKENDAVVATQVGALANVGLAGTKGIIGYGVNR